MQAHAHQSRDVRRSSFTGYALWKASLPNALELCAAPSYCRRMKRIFFLIVSMALCAAPQVHAQDAATQERLDKLTGQIEDLLAARAEQDKRITALTVQLSELREQSGKPNASYASQEDLKRLAEAVREVDRKRLDDYDKIHADLLKLGKTLSSPPPAPRRPLELTAPPSEGANSNRAGGDEKGFEYIVQNGDNLSTIVKAYREKNIKVTVEQIVKANPGLVPEKLRVGQKIFIPHE